MADEMASIGRLFDADGDCLLASKFLAGHQEYGIGERSYGFRYKPHNYRA